MLWLLTDKDVAVCQEAGRYLIAKNDVPSSTLLFMGIAIGDDQQTYGTLWEVRNSRLDKTFDFDRICESILTGENFLARVGVNDVKKWLKLEVEK
jgi:hypothetical protein